MEGQSGLKVGKDKGDILLFSLETPSPVRKFTVHTSAITKAVIFPITEIKNQNVPFPSFEENLAGVVNDDLGVNSHAKDLTS
jgi:hypothetical protein